MGCVFARAPVQLQNRCPYLRNIGLLLGVHISIIRNVPPAVLHVHVHTHNANFGTVWSIIVSALGREVQRCGLRVWRFAHLVVYAVSGLGLFVVGAVGGLVGWRFGWFVVWSVGGLEGWWFRWLAVWAVGGLRLVVCGLRLSDGGLQFARLAICAFSSLRG